MARTAQRVRGRTEGSAPPESVAGNFPLIADRKKSKEPVTWRRCATTISIASGSPEVRVQTLSDHRFGPAIIIIIITLAAGPLS